MELTSEREKVLEEVRQIPDGKLSDLYKLLREFRVGAELSANSGTSAMRFAGCWNEIGDDVFDDFQRDITERRRNASVRRRAFEAGAD